MMCRLICASVLTATLSACQGPSPIYYSQAHESKAQFKSAAEKLEVHGATAAHSSVTAPPVDIGIPTRRFDQSDEVSGLLDSKSQQRLAATAWLEHPSLKERRRRVSVARERFGQARQLEELLVRYRSYRQPDRHETAIVAPGSEALRGRISDAELAVAWFGLRQAILERHAEILRESSTKILLDEERSITSDHVQILDDLMIVIDAKIRTGSSQQADLLALRGERARLAATLAGIEARRDAAVARQEELLGGPAPKPLKLLLASSFEWSQTRLLTMALEHQPALLAERAQLDRREATLRLADLGASRSPGVPGGGVRAAIRAEARERVLQQQQKINSHEAAIERKLLTLQSELKAAQFQIDAIKLRSLPDAESALSDAQSSFAGRSGSFLDVYRATRRLLETELTLSRESDSYRRARINLPALIGSTQL